MAVDNAMAGIERWVSPGVLVAGNVYVRHTTGAITDDPTPGSLARRPLFVDASESANGIEVSARKLVGRTTGLVAYSFSNATMHAKGISFPGPASRKHALDAVMAAHLGGFNLGGAFTLASGSPYTRAVLGTAPGMPTGPKTLTREAADARRLPTYASLDASIDYTRVVHRAALSAFAGAQNVLGRRNQTWYLLSGICENAQAQATSAPQCANHDVLQAPVRFAPTVGLRVAVR
jgi:hypothetical protein